MCWTLRTRLTHFTSSIKSCFKPFLCFTHSLIKVMWPVSPAWAVLQLVFPHIEVRLPAGLSWKQIQRNKLRDLKGWTGPVNILHGFSLTLHDVFLIHSVTVKPMSHNANKQLGSTLSLASLLWLFGRDQTDQTDALIHASVILRKNRQQTPAMQYDCWYFHL